MVVNQQLVYTAIASSRNEKNISHFRDYLLYSSCKCPIIFNTETHQPAFFLVGHNEEVNGQNFVESIHNDVAKDQDLYVISTAHDNSANIWKVSDLNTTCPQYNIVHHILSPDDSLFQTRASIRLNNGEFISILTTINGNIYLFKDNCVVQSIESKICYFDAKFYNTTHVDNSSGTAKSCHFVALAGSDNKVHIYLLQNFNHLKHLLDLVGFNDWIKCLDFLPLFERPSEFLLAAACQDSLVQVWHLELTSCSVDESKLLRTTESKPFNVDSSTRDITLTCTLETVLSGHESFVYSLCWFKNHTNDSNELKLITCSADRTIIIWQSKIARRNAKSGTYQEYMRCPATEGVWKKLIQLGETGEANLPFLGVCLSKDEKTLYANSLRGAIHKWSVTNDNNHEIWIAKQSITGHFEAITDIVWSQDGKYLLSASMDKTCRLHGLAREDGRWHELARPQVHGYEINCLAPLNSIKFASGAEEKTIRTFEATQFFMKNFKAITGQELPMKVDNCLGADMNIDELPAHAQLPALGLSNRGSQFAFDVYNDDRDKPSGETRSSLVMSKGDNDNNDKVVKNFKLSDNNSWHEVSELVKQLAITDHLSTIPYEEILLQSTLWWEKNKLFGHCNELHALASTSDGKFLASASKANRADLAGVIIWETEKFRKVATLEHHNLTITRLRFSPNNNFLLSVSRDRTWCLFERNSSGQLRNAYHKLVGTIKSNAIHERIIWDCCWTSDSKYFCTVSRDKKMIVWSIERLKSEQVSIEPKVSIVATKLFDQAIQAVDCSTMSSEQFSCLTDDHMQSDNYIFALGLEDGSFELHLLSRELRDDDSTFKWRTLKRFDNFHQSSIRRLTFQPVWQHSSNEQARQSENNSGVELLLASGGDDCMVRLTRLSISIDD